MFKNEISSSPLMNEPANTLMANISGDRFMGDCSFVATLRALLFNRMPREDKINFRISRSDYSSNDVANTAKRDLVKNVCSHNNQIGQQGGFALHYFNNMTQKANQDCFAVVAEEFENTYPGYKKIDKITEFYRKAFPVACFVNTDLKSIVLFVEQMDYRRFHYLQCAIFPMVPWYFDPKAGVSEHEMKLVKSLMENTPDSYRDCISKICELFDFRSEVIKKKLAGFELRFIKDALANSEAAYSDITERIADFNRRLSEELTKLTDLNFRISGMRQKLEEGDGDDSEIMDYFLRNKNLTLIESSGANVDFIVRAKIEYYDPEMAESAIKNDHSLLYTRGRNIAKNDRKKLFQAIFLDNKIHVNVCAAFRLAVNGGVTTHGHYSYGEEFNNCMPHPHIDQYNCMGDYVRIVNDLMQRHDYIMALEQCIASARSLNFADGTVLEYFVKTLFDDNSKNRCLQLPDGKVVNAADAVKWLNEQKADAK